MVARTTRSRPNPTYQWTREGGEEVAPGAIVVPTFDGPTADELAALDDLGAKGKWTFAGRELSLTNLDKVLFPARDDAGPFTKRDLIRYFSCIAPVMLPYLVDRPLNLHRFPDGAGGKSFWQKQAPKYAPDWIPRWHNDDADAGESVDYLVADSPPALAWLANHGAVELHAWTSRIDDVHRPTYALIDLDPGTKTTWDDLLVLARLHRTALEHLGVRGYPKVSGQRGIQIWVPIRPGPSIRRDPGLGRAAVTRDRRDGARPRELDVDEERPGRARPPRLHPERDQQDARRALQHETGARGAGLGSDRVGRARRSRAAFRSLDDGHRARPRGRAR